MLNRQQTFGALLLGLQEMFPTQQICSVTNVSSVVVTSTKYVSSTIFGSMIKVSSVAFSSKENVSSDGCGGSEANV